MANKKTGNSQNVELIVITDVTLSARKIISRK
jgi:hypothetical protein